jgi:tetratricopeptide (TPR) repeat protein
MDTVSRLPGLPPILRARALFGAAYAAHSLGERRYVLEACEQALEIQRAEGAEQQVAFSLNLLAEHFIGSGEIERGLELGAEALAIRRKAPEAKTVLAGALWNQGVRQAFAGRSDRARELYEEALVLLDETGEARGAAQVTANLAATALDRGDLAEAARRAEEVKERLRGVGEGLDVAGTLRVVADVALAHQDSGSARAYLLQAFRLLGDHQNLRDTLRCLLLLASVEVQERNLERAARLFGAAEALLEPLGTVVDPGAQRRAARAKEEIRAGLGEKRALELDAHGRSLTLEQALVLSGITDLLAAER